MNEQTRYRLTGAIFLLSIGIIVLPMVFDGEGVRVKQLPELSEPLPPMPSASERDALRIPAAEVEQHRAEQSQVGGLLDADGYHTKDGTRLGDPLLRELAADGQEPEANERSADVMQTADAGNSVTSKATPSPADSKSDAEPRVAAAPSTDRTQGAPERRAPPVVEERSQPAKPLAKQSIWAVQLASFASPVNATALRDRLLGDGFEAWTSTARRDTGVRTRVAIGPLLDRGDAERMRDLVSGRYNVSAIVVHMEP